MAVYRLDEDLWFPMPEEALENGLLAVGGDLSPERLLLAYSHGIFPWFHDDNDIRWWCPRERFVIFPEEIHISRSMKKFIKKTSLFATCNGNFDAVIENCRRLREGQEGTWLTDGMEAAYKELHRMGYASSVEVWDRGELIGGLYGVTLGYCFFGESMFSLKPNASKVALIALANMLPEAGGRIIDCQFRTDHLARMGGRAIPYDMYMKYISEDEPF